MTLNFTKMNGAGNDFVLLDNRDGALRLDSSTISRVCDRHRGVGADGMLLVEPAQNGGQFRMRYYNSDGGEAEMCGNGARCFARYVQRLCSLKGGVKFETPAGFIEAEFCGAQVRLKMSTPKEYSANNDLDVNGEKVTVHAINTGVPHAVVFVKELENVDVRKLGKGIRTHLHFAPKGTNVNFLETFGPNDIAIRTFERGVEDETLACGTGVVASALIYSELTGIDGPIKVQVRGGDVLDVAFARTGSGTYEDVTLTGPADFVFDGTITPPAH